jgi:hypothetical protein
VVPLKLLRYNDLRESIKPLIRPFPERIISADVSGAATLARGRRLRRGRFS